MNMVHDRDASFLGNPYQQNHGYRHSNENIASCGGDGELAGKQGMFCISCSQRGGHEPVHYAVLCIYRPAAVSET